MKNPIPILSIWPLDYILNHANEMHACLNNRQVTILQDTSETYSPHTKPMINKHKVYSIIELRNNKVTVRDEDGETFNTSYKSIGLLDITPIELSRAIETQKSYILSAEMEIQKFSDWKLYMEENNIKVFNVNSFNANYLLEMFKQVQASKTELSIADLKKLVSTVIEG